MPVLRKPNRLKRQQISRTKFWCKCDKNLVSLAGRGRVCSVCGRKNNPDRRKKVRHVDTSEVGG